MKIRMSRTQRGAADGVTVITYEAGQEYELGESPRALDLALVFLGQGWAEEVRPRAMETSAPVQTEQVAKKKAGR